MNPTARFAVLLSLAAASAAVMAQTSTTPSTAASQPNTVGVTQDAAKAANDKAIQRADVATVVRTGPTAADRARQAGDRVQSNMTTSSNADGTTGEAAGTGNANRAPRADRN